ncbi:hypothetical protein HKD37_01G000161 [Glycine soja]
MAFDAFNDKNIVFQVHNPTCILFQMCFDCDAKNPTWASSSASIVLLHIVVSVCWASYAPL